MDQETGRKVHMVLFQTLKTLKSNTVYFFGGNCPSIFKSPQPKHLANTVHFEGIVTYYPFITFIGFKRPQV